MSTRARHRHRRWFLPESPDLIRLLLEQVDVTAGGIASFVAWAHGEPHAADAVRAAEHEADERRQRLLAAVREAFTTPLDPEDLFELSRGVDEILNRAKDTVREAEAMGIEPDRPLAEMVELVASGLGHLRDAVAAMGVDEAGADAAAASATKDQRRLERVYRRAMSDLIESDDLRSVIGLQELYRRLTSISEQVLDVADCVGYAIVKES